MPRSITKIRGVTLRQDETVAGKIHATLDGLHNGGDLYLTSQRLIWVAHRVRPPLTFLFGERLVSMDLADIAACYARGTAVVVEAGGKAYKFRVYRWFTRAFGWGLSRKWALAIDDARSRATSSWREESQIT